MITAERVRMLSAEQSTDNKKMIERDDPYIDIYFIINHMKKRFN
jgi:hypothetical protein